MKLTAKQEQARRLLSGPQKHVLLDGGSRSGKSAIIIRQIIVRAIKAPKSRHAVLRFRFNHCKESIGMDTLPKVLESFPEEVRGSMNRSDWYHQFPNRSEIWIGGLDDKERTEKILGKEFATLYLNEASQIPLNSRNLAVTRLAQRCQYDKNGQVAELALKLFYDANPPSKAHWLYQMFYRGLDPETKKALYDATNYAHLTMNPQDNAENLPPDYIASLEALGVRMRKRFLLGEYGESAPGALWTEEMIDGWRESSLPDMVRVVVAIDPSGADDEDNAHNDEIGIVVCGLGTDGNAYLLEDCTVKAGPKTWGNVAVTAYDRHAADKIVGETNYGGDMVRFVVQTAKPNVPFRKITASRGKAVRAEPIAALTEQGKIRFAGTFPLLETELCAFTTHGYTGGDSPNRADAFVFAISELFPGIVAEREKPKAQRPRSVMQGANGWMA